MESEKLFAWFITIWVLILLPTVYFEVITLQVTHSYTLPSVACVGRLTSDRGEWSTVREALLICAYIIVPFATGLMLLGKDRATWILYIFALFVVLAWSFLTFILDVNDMVVANVGPDSSSFRFTNYARDSRWCTLYGGQPGTELLCANIAPCSGGGVLIENLWPNNPFIFRFSVNVFYFGFICLHLFYSFRWTATTEKKK